MTHPDDAPPRTTLQPGSCAGVVAELDAHKNRGLPTDTGQIRQPPNPPQNPPQVFSGISGSQILPMMSDLTRRLRATEIAAEGRYEEKAHPTTGGACLAPVWGKNWPLRIQNLPDQGDLPCGGDNSPLDFASSRGDPNPHHGLFSHCA